MLVQWKNTYSGSVGRSMVRKPKAAEKLWSYGHKKGLNSANSSSVAVLLRYLRNSTTHA